MAEVAGLVIGAVSLASLFDTVLNNFDRIQVGREFGETYHRCLLQLEVLRLRLHRWRDAVNQLIEVDDMFLRQANGNLVQEHLNDIDNLFEKEEGLSKPYEVAIGETEDGRPRHWLVKSLRSLSLKHRANTPSSVRSQVRWAIRGKNEFDRLVTSISIHVSNLEHIIPTQELERRLNTMRSEDAGEIGRQREANIKDVDLLQEIAMLLDQKFADVVKMKAANEWIGNIAEENAMVHMGDLMASDYSGGAIALPGRWETNRSTGTSQVTMGTAYGFNPFARRT